MFTQFVPDPRHLWTLIISIIIPIATATLLPTGQLSAADPLVTEVSMTLTIGPPNSILEITRQYLPIIMR